MKNLYNKKSFYLDKTDLDQLTNALCENYSQGFGVNLEEGATAKDRNKQIGGHKA